ncbi:hypothetical protein G9A89_016558 [Geosiphon pyriformis]|nr:hypothetical protein G9A89_016558 [Geosiphon pyriformis]
MVSSRRNAGGRPVELRRPEPTSAPTPMVNLNSVLDLANEFGYQISSFTHSTQITSSIRLMDLLDELLSVQDNIEKLRKDIIKFKDTQETHDLVQSSELEKKITILKDLGKQVELILENKQILITRLKDPYIGDHIDVEPQYHQVVAELFPTIMQNIALVPHDLESMKWIKDHNQTLLSGEKLNKQISSSTSLIAMYGNYAATLDRVRNIVEEMRNSYKGKGKEKNIM